jgi:hypothetical protein
VLLPGVYDVDALSHKERVAAEEAKAATAACPAGSRGSAAVGVAVAFVALLG